MKRKSSQPTKADWKKLKTELQKKIEELNDAKTDYDNFIAKVHDYCRVIGWFDRDSQLKITLFLIAGNLSHTLGIIGKVSTCLLAGIYGLQRMMGESSETLGTSVGFTLLSTCILMGFDNFLDKWYQHWNDKNAENNFIDHKVITETTERLIYDGLPEHGNLFVDKFLKRSKKPTHLFDRVQDLADKYYDKDTPHTPQLFKQTRELIHKIQVKQTAAQVSARQRCDSRVARDKRPAFMI